MSIEPSAALGETAALRRHYDATRPPARTPPAFAPSNPQHSGTALGGGAVRWISILATLVVVAVHVSPCHAQPKVDGVFAVQTGGEGADPGLGQVVWQRARTRLALGGEWFTEEALTEAVGLYALVEVERSGGFGAEVRYRRWVNRWLGGFAGVTSILQPESLLGVTGGATAIYGLGGKASVFAEVSASVFPLGTDLPHPDAVLVWLSLGLGVRLGF